MAKVEALTRQLEDLRKDRRGPLNLITGLAAVNGSAGQKGGPGGNGSNNTNSPTAKELEKLRRELMVSDRRGWARKEAVLLQFSFVPTLHSTAISCPCNRTRAFICNERPCNNDSRSCDRWTCESWSCRTDCSGRRHRICCWLRHTIKIVSSSNQRSIRRIFCTPTDSISSSRASGG